MDSLIFYISGLSGTLLYIGLHPPHLTNGQPTDPLIFYISGLSSTPFLHWLTSSPPDQWIFYFHGLIDLPISVVCPVPLLYIGLHPPHLTNGSYIYMVNPQTH